MSEGILQFGIKSRDWKEVTTTGQSATINSTAGRVVFSAHTSTAEEITIALTVTNNRVSTNSVVLVELESNTATALAVKTSVVPADGSFVVTFQNIPLTATTTALTAVTFRFFVLNGAVY